MERFFRWCGMVLAVFAVVGVMECINIANENTPNVKFTLCITNLHAGMATVIPVSQANNEEA